MRNETSIASKATVGLFGLNAAIWLVLGVTSLYRMGGSGDISQTTALIIAVLMFGNAAGMLLVGFGIARRIKLFFYLALALLGVNVLLTFTDEFGVLDLITLVIDLVLVGLLIINRLTFTRVGQQ